MRCEVYLEVSCTPLKLQLKPPTLFLSPSENLQLHEVLPEVLPVVPLDVNNDVHLFLSHPKQAIQLESQCQKG